MTGIPAALSLTGAVGLGLSASALHARAHRRREARLGLLLDAVAAFPGGAMVPQIADKLGLTPYQRGKVYADLDVLERRGMVVQHFDGKRMSWTATRGASHVRDHQA